VDSHICGSIRMDEHYKLLITNQKTIFPALSTYNWRWSRGYTAYRCCSCKTPQ